MFFEENTIAGEREITKAENIKLLVLGTRQF